MLAYIKSLFVEKPPLFILNTNLVYEKIQDVVDIFETYSSSKINLRDYEEFLHDGQPIMRVAQLIEKYNRHSQDIPDKETRQIYLNDAYENIEYKMRAEFKEYADAHNISTLDTIAKFKDKFAKVFPVDTFIPRLLKEVELDSWIWNDDQW